MKETITQMVKVRVGKLRLHYIPFMECLETKFASKGVYISLSDNYGWQIDLFNFIRKDTRSASLFF